jgi:hypothetical protein
MLTTRITTAKYWARLSLLVGLLFSYSPWSVANDIYQCTNNSGQVVFQQRPCPGGDDTQRLITSPRSSPTPSSTGQAVDSSITRDIALDAKAKEMGVSRELLDRLEGRAVEGSSKVKIKQWKVRRPSGDYIYIEGLVKNISGETLNYIKLRIKGLSTYGQLLYSHDTFISPSDLAPRAEGTFSQMVEKNRQISHFNLKVLD